jgi:hypothetical protein
MKARSDSSFPSAATFENFGSKPKLVKTVMDFCQDRTGYEDIVLLCAKYAPRGGQMESIVQAVENMHADAEVARPQSRILRSSLDVGLRPPDDAPGGADVYNACRFGSSR